MGWNKGYSVMEETVVAVYNHGALSKELLNAIMQPYVDYDIDHGGCNNLRSEDGLSADEIICKVMEPEQFAKIGPMPTEKPDYVKQDSDGKFFTPGLEYYKYDDWKSAVKNKRDSDIYVLWLEIVRNNWNLC